MLGAHHSIRPSIVFCCLDIYAVVTVQYREPNSPRDCGMYCGWVVLCGVAHKSGSEGLYLLFEDDLLTKSSVGLVGG